MEVRSESLSERGRTRLTSKLVLQIDAIFEEGENERIHVSVGQLRLRRLQVASYFVFDGEPSIAAIRRERDDLNCGRLAIDFELGFVDSAGSALANQLEVRVHML